MQFKVANVYMGKAYQPDEYLRKVTDAERVKTIINLFCDPCCLLL
jgi:hypothetical protein